MKKELENWLADLAKKQPKTAEEAEAFFWNGKKIIES